MPVPKNDLPETRHTENLHVVRTEITPLMAGIFDILHETLPIKIGEQWSIPMHSSCGFSAELILRVRAAGTCPPNSDAFTDEACKERFLRFLDLFMQHYGINPEEDNNATSS